MQTPVRYYITCDDDRPVVRTIPVAVRQPEQATQEPQAGDATTQGAVGASRAGKKPRMTKAALAKARRLRVRAHRSS